MTPRSAPPSQDRSEAVRVLVLGASLREGSLNRILARRAAEVIEARGHSVDQAEMHEFDAPSYNQDLEREAGLPPAAEAFRARLEATNAFVVASPEYNFSIPGSLKNSIDWVSRARPQPFNARHGLLLSASPSMVGGNRGLWALRIPLEHLGARVFPDMFSLAQAQHGLDAEGRFVDERLRIRFEGTIGAFLDLVEADTHYACVKKAWVEFLGERPDPETDREE
jgi:chromate reductase, NAD(P)H dehydrogenase (quinone)